MREKNRNRKKKTNIEICTADSQTKLVSLLLLLQKDFINRFLKIYFTDFRPNKK